MGNNAFSLPGSRPLPLAKPWQPAHGVPIFSAAHADQAPQHSHRDTAEAKPAQGREGRGPCSRSSASSITASHLPQVDPEKAHAAADRLWQDLVRSVNQAAPAQPAPGRKSSRTRSGQ